MLCGLRLSGSAGAIGEFLCGLVNVGPWMLLNGSVKAKVGRFLDRAWVKASNPEASLISVGSLNAVPKKLIPIGAPETLSAGTCTIGEPPAAALLEVPKMKRGR